MNIESNVKEIFIDDIIPNRFQPRLNFNEDKIQELATSIKTHGIIQPLVLRRVGEKFEIIAGERRFKAATLAGLNKVPAIITDLDDNESAEIALVENIQRKDLSAIEEAKSFKKLLDRGHLNQEQLAQKMGVSQSSIANKLRLLNLDESVQQALLEEKISERHARSLLSVSDFGIQRELLNKIQQERYTVKQLDQEITKLKDGDEINMNPVQEVKENSLENIESLISYFELENKENETQPTPLPQEVSFNEEPPVLEELPRFVDEGTPQINVDLTQEVKPDLTDAFSFFNIQDETPLVENVVQNDNSIPSLEELMSAPTEPITEPIEDKIFEDYFRELVPSMPNPAPLYSGTENQEVQAPPIQEFSFNIDKTNFRTVENAFENLKQEIEKAGLKIDMDTYSFDQYYQLIIKVFK